MQKSSKKWIKTAINIISCNASKKALFQSLKSMQSSWVRQIKKRMMIKIGIKTILIKHYMTLRKVYIIIVTKKIILQSLV